MQAYSDPRRSSDPHSLPDVEVFYVSPDAPLEDPEGDALAPGWYWWSCFPGCLPDSDPVGPFPSQEDALADAQDPC